VRRGLIGMEIHCLHAEQTLGVRQAAVLL